MSDMSKVADAMRQCGIEDMERIAAMLYQLTDEEHAALAQSHICIRCHHREILHYQADYEYDAVTPCRICDCEGFVKEQ